MAGQVAAAMRKGMKILMAHENDAARGGCDFGIFFAGRTPEDLKQGGLYTDLALALYSGGFWPVSVALVAKALGAVEAGSRGSFSTAGATRPPAEQAIEEDAQAALQC